MTDDGLTGSDVDWFTRTGHCGHCGNPGSYCSCTDTDPCGCRDLHQMGSARTVDALDQFSDTASTLADDDQGELF